MEARADELFFSAADVRNSMPYQLSWSPPAMKNRLWVFWSRQNNELRNLLSPLYPGVDTSSFENRAITGKIKAIIGRGKIFQSGSYLIQFWAPVRTGDRIYLTMADQPFGLNKFHKGLCSYRRLCVSEILIPVLVNEPGDEEEHNLGPQFARVFRRGLSEYCDDMSCYFSEEYPLRDYVVQRGVKCYYILPLFKGTRDECIGILEILSTSSSSYGTLSLVSHLSDQLKGVGVGSGQPPSSVLSKDVNMPILTGLFGQSYAQKQMEAICEIHQIPFAQMWTASSTTREITRISGYSSKNKTRISDSHINWGNFEGFDLAMHGECIREGEGVVGKAFSMRSACFCNNLSKLSISMDPSALIARKFRVAGCFAICLQSTRGGTFYILEFFLAPSGVDYGDPRNFVNMLVTTLKKNIESSAAGHLQKVGEKLFVEVIKISSDDELDSFEICTTTRTGSTPLVFKHPEGREMMQHDYQQVDATNNMSAKQNHAINRNVGDSLFPASLSASESIFSNALCQGGINIVPTHGNETTQGNVNTEQNIGAGSWLTTVCSRISVAQSLSLSQESVAQSLSLSQESVAVQGNCSIMVKAKYGHDTIKIPLSFSSGKRELEEEVAKRLDLSTGSFKIKYLDEDEDPILVACDADLRTCMSISRSLGKTTIKMLIIN